MFGILTERLSNSCSSRDRRLPLASGPRQFGRVNSKRIRAVFLAITLILTTNRLVSATTGYSIDLYNSSEYPVELISDKSSHTLGIIVPGRSLRIAYSHGINLRTHDGQVVHYERVDPPKELMQVNFLASVFMAQLTSDMKIWIVAPTAKRPALPPPQQPPGFPLRAR